jgi:hypothetical protein
MPNNGFSKLSPGCQEKISMFFEALEKFSCGRRAHASGLGLLKEQLGRGLGSVGSSSQALERLIF